MACFLCEFISSLPQFNFKDAQTCAFCRPSYLIRLWLFDVDFIPGEQIQRFFLDAKICATRINSGQISIFTYKFCLSDREKLHSNLLYTFDKLAIKFCRENWTNCKRAVEKKLELKFICTGTWPAGWMVSFEETDTGGRCDAVRLTMGIEVYGVIVRNQFLGTLGRYMQESSLPWLAKPNLSIQLKHLSPLFESDSKRVCANNSNKLNPKLSNSQTLIYIFVQTVFWVCLDIYSHLCNYHNSHSIPLLFSLFLSLSLCQSFCYVVPSCAPFGWLTLMITLTHRLLSLLPVVYLCLSSSKTSRPSKLYSHVIRTEPM